MYIAQITHNSSQYTQEHCQHAIPFILLQIFLYRYICFLIHNKQYKQDVKSEDKIAVWKLHEKCIKITNDAFV